MAASHAPAEPARARAPEMAELEELGWDVSTVGELDHRLLRVPSVKLRSALGGGNGDVVFCVDLRIRRPNAGEYLSTTELHSLEHFLLAGFRRHLPAHFISVGIMGCRTGFYLAFLNEGRPDRICGVLETILTDIQGARTVPYAHIDQCGDYVNHSVELARRVAREVLSARAGWRDVT